jgi:UrcA family protein
MKTALVILCAAAFLTDSSDAKPVLVTAEALPLERVSFSDLNLSSTAGQETLKRRIRGAADRVCEVAADRSFDSYLITHRCFASAYKDGLRQMDTLIVPRGSTVTAAFLMIRGE